MVKNIQTSFLNIRKEKKISTSLFFCHFLGKGLKALIMHDPKHGGSKVGRWKE